MEYQPLSYNYFQILKYLHAILLNEVSKLQIGTHGVIQCSIKKMILYVKLFKFLLEKSLSLGFVLLFTIFTSICASFVIQFKLGLQKRKPTSQQVSLFCKMMTKVTGQQNLWVTGTSQVRPETLEDLRMNGWHPSSWKPD